MAKARITDEKDTAGYVRIGLKRKYRAAAPEGKTLGRATKGK